MKTHRTNRAGTGPLSGTARHSSCGRNQEDRLLSRLRAGEEEAFETVVRQYQERLTRTAIRYVGNRATAEDVVQDAWMAMLQGVNRFEGRSSLTSWICAILIHKAKDRGVREKRYRAFSDFTSEDHDSHHVTDPSHVQPRKNWVGRSVFPSNFWDERTPEHLVASKQAIACLAQAIEGLPTGLKDVLILRDVDGVRTEEVCQQLNISESNLYVRLHRARERVRTAVETAL